MEPPIWLKAVTDMPRLDRAQWDRLGLLPRWLIGARAATLILTVIPCLIVGLLALRARRFDLTLWLLVTVGLVLAHATNNFLNDLVDHRMGVDRDNYFRTRYGVQPVESGLLSQRHSLLYATATALVALACGLWLVHARGGPTLWLMLVGAGFVLAYTWPLKYVGLGEIAVLAVWGPLMIGGGYFVVTGLWDGRVALASLPYGLGAASVIFGKHIDKLQEDKARRIATLPVLLGPSLSRYLAMAMMAGQYVAVVWLVVTGYFSVALLVVAFALTALAPALRVFSRPRPAAPPPDYPASTWPLWFVAFAFVHNRAFGLWFLAGLAGDVLLGRLGR